MSPIDEFYMAAHQPTPVWYLYDSVAEYADKLDVCAGFNKGDEVETLVRQALSGCLAIDEKGIHEAVKALPNAETLTAAGMNALLVAVDQNPTLTDPEAVAVVANAMKKKQKELLQQSWKNPTNIEAILKTAKAFKGPDFRGVRYCMNGVYDLLRENVGLFDCWDTALRTLKIDAVISDLSLNGFVGKEDSAQTDAADKVAWLHSALIGYLSHHFTSEQVELFIKELSLSRCSKFGKLEALVNVLKSPSHRVQAWNLSESSAIVEAVDSNDDPKVAYKCVFAYWMLSFDNVVMSKLAGKSAVCKIKEFLSSEAKTEKIVRLSLKVLHNFCNCKSLEEDIASSNILPAVRALEYEKWREEELYKDITALCQSISATVEKVSNFERYQKELDEAVAGGTLRWGALHTTEFWAHSNTQKAMHKDIIVNLVKLVTSSTDVVTQKVACNDLGEISLQKTATMKSWLVDSMAKEAVMKRMADHNDKEVRREALLCCQKMMLNKWQDASKK